MPWTIVQLSPKPQMSERRSNTICAVLERPGESLCFTALQQLRLLGPRICKKEITWCRQFKVIPGATFVVMTLLYFRPWKIVWYCENFYAFVSGIDGRMNFAVLWLPQRYQLLNLYVAFLIIAALTLFIYHSRTFVLKILKVFGLSLSTRRRR